MAYKTLLTIQRDAALGQPALDAAITLAERFDAHLDVLCLGVDEVQLGYFFSGADAVMQPGTLEVARERAEALVRSVTAQLEASRLRFAVRGLVAQFGALTDSVSQIARYADLVIASQPYGEGTTPEDEAVLEAALFSGQVPVLVIPPAGLPDNFGRVAVLGWNDGTEALQAVRAALPLLQEADLASVAIVDPPSRAVNDAGPGRSLCTMLDRHGVTSEIAVLAKTRPRVADVLMAHGADRNASLLVAGGYGHSRFRQAIIGGATRDLLGRCSMPVLLAH